MNSEKRPNRSLNGVDSDDLVASILREKGVTIPTSDEEVAQAESEIDEDSVELPASLRDPKTFLSRKVSPEPLRFPRSRQPIAEFSQELARVAREEGEISQDIKNAMRRDRLKAEDRSRER